MKHNGSKKMKIWTAASLAALTLTAGTVYTVSAVRADGLTAAAAGSAAVHASAAAQAAAASSTAADKIVDQYNALLKKRGQLPQAFAFLNKHIGDVSKRQATLMTLHLENAVKKALPAMEARFNSTSVQTAIFKVYRFGDDFADVIKRTKDRKLIALLKEADASGYKLETAEGMFFPIVDYTKFRKYGAYVNPDIKAYFDIMAVESEKAVAKDAALTIGYQELVNRTLSMEQFVAKYPYSNRAAQVKTLFDRYKLFTFYGLSNTPLFDYNTKTIIPNAKKGYTLVLQYNKPSSSEYLTLLQKFMKLLKDENYKLTAKVEAFRSANIPIE